MGIYSFLHERRREKERIPSAPTEPVEITSKPTIKANIDEGNIP